MKHPMSRRHFLARPLALPLVARGAVPGDPIEATLEAAEMWTMVGDRSALLYGYNGRIPGPLIEARPGSVVRIEFRNQLPESTNLHFHGLHIPPDGSADNSFRVIPAGGSFQYEFTVPSNHAGGTFWIHPHVHGSAARQVSRGLAAPFVIRGELDEIPEIQSAPEFLLVLQDFELSDGGIPREPGFPERMLGREGNLIAVSGRVQPVIPIRKGGWVRLRLLNASSSRFYRLRLEEHTMFQIATDGGALPVPRPLEELLLTPGERAEVMVQGSRPAGSFRLVNLPYSRGNFGTVTAVDDSTLATVSYEGEEQQPVRLPERLVSLPPLPPPVRVRSFALGQGMGMMGGGFTINGRTFDPTRIDTRARLGEVEEWEFVNGTRMDHPMHIHTNAVRVIQRDGSVEQSLRDVVLVRAGLRVRVRMQFLDYTGKAMYHCHILDHEDLGMMGVLEITR
ncbi:MAG: multicopper oxidase family protein [Candidatus Solibacter usitatus]|nr:multicopper oxidase family protein [Candidatus Solibacter usitatus]